MIKVAVSGCEGRMGSRVKRLVEEDPALELTSGFDVDDDPRRAIEKCDVLIEFTSPDATVKNVGIARELGKAAVVGTTGLDKEKAAFIQEAAGTIPIVFSPNMAVGVNLLFKLAGDAAAVLDETFTASISETHHVHKKDAPSGTARRLRDIVAGARGAKPEDITVASQRTGEVVGDHALVLDGKEERLEFIHRAKSRDAFARGAIMAAKFIAGRKKGLYGMGEVLGIS